MLEDFLSRFLVHIYSTNNNQTPPLNKPRQAFKLSFKATKKANKPCNGFVKHFNYYFENNLLTNIALPL